MSDWWTRIRNYIDQLPIIKRTVNFLQKNSLPGFKGVSIMKILHFIYKETQRDDIMTRANSMAFSFFISLFPFLLLLFSVISFIPVDRLSDLVMDLLADILPSEGLKFVDQIIVAAFSRERIDLLSIGFLLSLYFASNGMEAMMRGFDKDYDFTFRKRTWLQRRGAALRLTIFIGLLCLVAMILIIGSSILFTWLENHTGLGRFKLFSYNLLRWFLVFLLFYGVIGCIYHYAPPTKKRFSYFSIGTNFATLFSILSSIVFSYIVNTFGNYDNFYGPLGTLVMIMLWLQINCFILLAGFELNAGIAVYSDISRRRALSNQQ